MNGSTFLLYTTEECGKFIVGGRCSESEYETIKESRQIDVTPRDIENAYPKFVTPVLVMLLRVEDNFDFVMGTSRETRLAAA